MTAVSVEIGIVVEMIVDIGVGINAGVAVADWQALQKSKQRRINILDVGRANQNNRIINFPPK